MLLPVLMLLHFSRAVARTIAMMLVTLFMAFIIRGNFKAHKRRKILENAMRTDADTAFLELNVHREQCL